MLISKKKKKKGTEVCSTENSNVIIHMVIIVSETKSVINKSSVISVSDPFGTDRQGWQKP